MVFGIASDPLIAQDQSRTHWRDGEYVLLTMKYAGSLNIVQDEQNCVVFGIRKVAIQANAVHRVLALNEIAGAKLEQVEIRAVPLSSTHTVTR